MKVCFDLKTRVYNKYARIDKSDIYKKFGAAQYYESNIVEQLKCDIHHCGHPNKEDGSHTHPDSILNIDLVETEETQTYHVPFGENVIYRYNFVKKFIISNLFHKNRNLVKYYTY